MEQERVMGMTFGELERDMEQERVMGITFGELERDMEQERVMGITFGELERAMRAIWRTPPCTCSTTCMGRADNTPIATRHSCEVKGCNTMTICGC